MLFFNQASHAHEKHGEDLKPSQTLSGSSVLQLGSLWKDQKGESVNIAELGGKPRLVVMLFTRCETACPLIIEDLKRIAAEIDTKKLEKIEVSIFSFDSSRETPLSLMDFSRKRNLPTHWRLFTSKPDAVAELAASLGVRYKRLQNGDFIHSNVIYLLNSKGEVAAKKEGLNTPRADFIKEIEKT